MNRIYQSIWNQKIGTFVAVSEFAKRGGRKIARGSGSVSASGVRFTLKPLIASMLLAVTGNAWALPVGGEVSAGSATIGGDATVMEIKQSTQNAAINWQAFDIASGETVNFAQPNSSAVALNRVLGSDPSAIMGTLTANGSVFLINPNGVLFGQNASVNVGGLVASTLAISDSDFMAGRYNFAGTGDGSIVNQGTINADGGYVALLGADVSNQGTLQANLGTVALAAGDAITLDVAGDGLLNVAVNQGALDALVQNGGMIQADGGKVLMTAQSAGELFQSTVNNTGEIRAQSIENRNGTIMLTGDMQSGTLNLGGSLDVSGSEAGETGGSVTATAHHVGLYDAVVDASGDAGGGSVLIGGGYQGKDAAVPNASATYMSADSSIYADAITTGDGGTAVLWADDSTRAYGSISARGGAQSGDGGLIETSGGWLDVSGIRIDTRAPNGSLGMWLLDPADITISDAATSGATETGNVFAPDDGVNAANINVADLVTGLGSSNITVTTENSGASGSGNGDITVMNFVTWEDPTTLTFNADRDINIDAAVTGTLGSLVANAGRDVNVDAAVTTTTGNLSFIADDDVNINAATTITTGDLTALAGQDVNVGAAISVTTGDVILIADNDGTGPGAILGGTVDITCADCITITDPDSTLVLRFNPESYATTEAEILAYELALVDAGGSLDAKAWVFGQGEDKVYDGLRDATVSGFEPDITSAQPPVTLGTTSNALFDTKDVGTEKPITYETSFSDPVYDLFAPYNDDGTPPAAGTYFTRADITPAPLTITANDGSKVFGETYPLSRQAFTSVGLVNAETVTGVTLTSPGAVATASVDGSPYAITPADATGGTFSPGNYKINYVNGALFVSSTSVGPGAATPVYPTPVYRTPVYPTPVYPTSGYPDPVYPTPGYLTPVYLAPVYPTYGDSDQESTTQTMEGLELTFATAAITMPTSQLDRVDLLQEDDLVTSPSDAYVAPVYAPKQDRF
ncbi:filamentous hemagglutinin N-terminal domain-containing protein [Halomonas daqiaonensis]|uniref:Filamentous hemagglutinin family N-terminal domain-containing protein n=1 Tax=Halomonas daqiaonensis TaxID=650850 RepID=A0A1H7T0Y3_9GAMM|nr:filamentous hemagglutinin N-terminal domain-containing protein [Halomonas daqiaonensis]SEL78378.1 filamentous hemagglutinin family N-terminal domain-containing protein [Halomonas daqiaonensis]